MSTHTVKSESKNGSFAKGDAPDSCCRRSRPTSEHRIRRCRAVPFSWKYGTDARSIKCRWAQPTSTRSLQRGFS